MAKIKNKKQVTSEKVHSKKTKLNVPKSLNPFEVHVNREKLKVLGKKQKNDRGLPGVARAKAIEKRKHTLLQEYKVKNKSNQFSDKRIGEKSKSMTDDEKIMARFTAVRIKANNRKSIFNLADDEVLTHKGQTLSEIEKFDDPRSDDEDSLDDERAGKLDRNFVEEAHFGGGMLKKTGIEGAKTHKDVIEQLIADSKKRKAEKQRIKEATLELTEKLDTEWKDLIPLVNTKNKTDEDKTKSNLDDYDKLMGELKFEARGTVSDRLKTEDEIAKEEKEKLEELERERLKRMKGIIDDDVIRPNHRSADDLDDDYVEEDITEENMLSYNQEGESNLPVHAIMNGKTMNTITKIEDDSGEEDDITSDEQDEQSDEESEAESVDNFSDLKDTSTSESDEDIVDVATSKQKTVQNEALVASDKDCNDEKLQENNIHKSKDDNINSEIRNEQLKDEIMEQARNELPFTFSLPKNYEELQKVLENQSIVHQSVIIERMLKCNHPSLAEGNKDTLGLLFAYLLQYINDLFSDNLGKDSIAKNFGIFKALIPQIYELAELIRESAHSSILEVIKEKHEEYRKSARKYPGLEVLIFLKLVSILWPTSDFRHQIVTPCFIFMEQMLTKCRADSRRSISFGFFITTLILEYTAISKRYLPAAIIYLSGLLHMAIPKSTVKLLKVMKPFKPTASDLVLLENNSLDTLDSTKMQCTDLLDHDIDEKYKIRIIYNTVQVLEQFHCHFNELPSNVEIFEKVLTYLELLPTINYPVVVQKSIDKLIDTLKEDKKKRKLNYIVMAAKKPKALRLYEPKIVEVYDYKQHKMQSKEKAERNKLIHKVKKEKKGALREIRKDKAFLGRFKIKQKIQSDKERREKVKRIYAEAAMQQSELNELDRKKKRKK